MSAPDLAAEPYLARALDGVQLIEASAGTGKTYTLATLFTRLIVEQRLRMGQVLAVTYTEAATQELRKRIRERLALATNVIGTPVFTIPYAACADSGIGSAEGVLAVSGQAHGTDGHTDLLHDADQLQTLLPRPIQTGQPRIGLVNADLHKVVAAFPGTVEHFAPAQGTGHGLFV